MAFLRGSNSPNEYFEHIGYPKKNSSGVLNVSPMLQANFRSLHEKSFFFPTILNTLITSGETKRPKFFKWSVFALYPTVYVHAHYIHLLGFAWVYTMNWTLIQVNMCFSKFSTQHLTVAPGQGDEPWLALLLVEYVCPNGKRKALASYVARQIY